MAVPGTPGAVTFRPGLPSAGYPFFERLIAHPGCTHAYPMRSLEQIDPKKTPGMSAGKVGPERLPWNYDPAEDSAYISIHPAAGFIEPQTRRLQVGTLEDRRSFFFTFDFKYNDAWFWQGEGYVRNYKNWYCYCGEQYWIQASHTHLHRGPAQDPPGVRETIGLLWLGFPSAKWKDGQPKLFGEPLSWRQGEKLQPLTTEFYPKVWRWSRHIFFVEGTHGDGATTSPVHLSSWYMDESRDPVLVYDRVPLHSLAPMTVWTFSYDTSAEASGGYKNSLMKKWIRNVAVLRGLTLADVQKLLERPSA